MKDLRKIILSGLALALCLFMATNMGLDIREFVTNININVEKVLKVAIVCTFLMAVKYLLKFLIGLLKFPKLATFVTLTRSAIDYLILILTVVWSLRILGADINGIIAGLGILALIIGTSAEGLIEDMLTGIFMLFEREYKVGDIIEVDGFLGTVTNIGIRTTTLVDNAGNEKIFNNSSMKDILNRSTYESVAVCDFELPMDIDIDKVVNADYGDITCLGLEEVTSDCLLVRFIKKVPEAEVHNERRRMNAEIYNKLNEMDII